MLPDISYNHERGETQIYFQSLNHWFKLKWFNSKVIIVDKNVYNNYSQIIEQLNAPIFLFNATERNKSYNSVLKILNFFYQCNVDRSTLIIVIGGGLTCDIGAFSTSVWKRGCLLMLVPTTLLAMVDAAIGGKTAINFKNKKNIIGTFYHPDFILICKNFLQTLPKNIYVQGIAEVIKHAVTLNKPLFEELLKNSNLLENNFYNYIKQNIETKLQVVLDDPFERNKRKILNFGHTIGHSLEMAYKLPHGIAVAKGMLLEASVLKHIGIWENDDVINSLQFILYKLLPLNKTFTINYHQIEESILHDKKKNYSIITLTVINDIGKAELLNLKLSDFLNALKDVINNEIKS
jgi:3-dehydroquinate synthetase